VSPLEAAGLFWIAIGALVMPMLARRLNIPSAVAELIYGIAVGPHLLGLVSESSFIEFMAQVGFAILMFSAGMEIDFRPFRKGRSKLLPTAWLYILAVVLCGVAGVYALGLGPWPVLAVCSVSVGLASVLLREKGLTALPIGQAVLAAGLVGETLSILFLTVLDFKFRFGFSAEFYVALVRFASIFVLAYVVLRIFRFIIWWYPEKLGVLVESGDPLELGVRLAVAVMFIFVAVASLFEVEAILGAFLAGALFGYIFQEREVVAEKINAMGQGFFVPFFFIVVGTRFDPGATSGVLINPLFFKLLLLALAAKLLPSLLLSGAGLRFKESLSAGLLLAAPLTLTIAVAELGGKQGAITDETQGLLIMVAVTTGLLCPFVARLILRSKNPQEKNKSPS
jgi:Kef-type K+ transport system membrane component KefB